MPHECTNCDRTFPDGSKEMLSGCPDCGGNKFRYRPSGGRLDESDDEETPPESPDPESAPDGPETPGGGSHDDPPGVQDGSSAATTVSNAASTLRNLVGGSADGETADSGSDPGTANAESATEDAAQASARSSVVDPDEIPGSGPETSGPSPSGDQSASPETVPGGSTAEPTGDTASTSVSEQEDDPSDGEAPDDSNLDELRQELNDQFESIKIVEPGQYELNLMELYDRDEYIISLKEDGRYVIEVPETWRNDTPR